MTDRSVAAVAAVVVGVVVVVVVVVIVVVVVVVVVVVRHRDDFQALVSDEVDLLFGNEAELISLYETETFVEAVVELRKHCEFAASRHEALIVVARKNEGRPASRNISLRSGDLVDETRRDL